MIVTPRQTFKRSVASSFGVVVIVAKESASGVVTASPNLEKKEEEPTACRTIQNEGFTDDIITSDESLVVG